MSNDFKLGVVAESQLDTPQIFQWRKQAVRKGWISLPAGGAKKRDRPIERGDTSTSAVEIVVDGITIRAGGDVD